MNRKQRRAAGKTKPSPGPIQAAGQASSRTGGREALLTLGRQLHADGRLEAADRYYVQALKADPTDAEALRLRGALAHQIGNHKAAVELLKRAAARLPDDAEVRLHLAAALEATGDRGTAERVYRKALKLAPENGEAAANLAAFLRADPAKRAEAEGLLRDALARAPEAVQPAYHLAALLIQTGRAGEALAIAERAAERASEDLDVLTLVGVARQHLGDLAGAETAFREIDRRAPGNLGAAINLASLLIAAERAEEAEGVARAALLAAPHSAPALFNLGVVLTAAEKIGEAEDVLRHALAHAPDHADGWGNYGNLLRIAGRHEEALTAYDRALSLAPDDARHRFQKAMGLLALGRLAEGWDLYDAGIACGERRGPPPIDAPRWRGERLASDAHLLIQPEQGVGDEIRFLGLTAEAAARAGAATTVQVDPRLVPLARRSLPGVEVVESGVPPAVAPTHRISMGDLPALFRRDLNAFPARAGHLAPDPERVAEIRARLDALGPGLKVGVAWKSGLVSLRRKTAHGPLVDWAAALNTRGVIPVCMQYGDVADEIAEAEAALGVRVTQLDGLDLKDDMDGAAALAAALDLTISTGSSVVDLAGAAGAPVWALLRPRDWVTLGTDRHPWAPSVRVFFRKPGEGWARLLEEEVAPALADLAGR
ncbi:MAG: tetratricopeptide repeat protein [Marivibrio sp.]|uniref:tetratricopeptide repeat protein n=1 Tax=Marivibrio sp. TaxID=2039719 RepID=UPI0032EB31CE